ncbi:MAG: hypothetical protein MI919_21810 [Holophagales bacterium]|nr:hypothetical protein [Holophagales bacterium]
MQHFETVLRLQEPVVNVTGVDVVVFQWSTDETTGTVHETDLFNWKTTLYADGQQIYTDNVVVGGVVQLFDGQVRLPETGFYWRFNLGTGGLEEMVNASYDLAENTTGEHFVVNDSISIPDDNIVDIRKFLDGVIQDGQSDQLDVQTTEPMVFFDGFESGNTSLWSQSVP